MLLGPSMLTLGPGDVCTAAASLRARCQCGCLVDCCSQAYCRCSPTHHVVCTASARIPARIHSQHLIRTPPCDRFPKPYSGFPLCGQIQLPRTCCTLIRLSCSFCTLRLQYSWPSCELTCRVTRTVRVD